MCTTNPADINYYFPLILDRRVRCPICNKYTTWVTIPELNAQDHKCKNTRCKFAFIGLFPKPFK